VRRQRLYEVLADRITDFVEAQGLSPGERLPPERLLAEALGVSRATLSQALVALEVRGVVDVRHGDGAVLTPTEHRPPERAAPDLADAGPGPLEEALAALLPALAALAAERATAAQRGDLPAAAAEGELGAVRALGAASGSPVLADFAERVAAAREAVREEAQEVGREGAARREGLAALAAAVAGGDRDAARRAAEAAAGGSATTMTATTSTT
jgi:GntR family transcriptional repressor for pyruvate dehydrogenase complex